MHVRPASLSSLVPTLVAALALLCGTAAPAHGQEAGPASAEGTRGSLRSEPALAYGDRLVDWETYAAWLLRERGQSRVVPFSTAVAVERLAARRGVVVTEEEVLSLVQRGLDERVTEAFGGDRQAWTAEVERLGRSVEGLVAERVESVRLDLFIQRLAGIGWAPSEEEVVALWELRHGRRGRGVAVRGLFLKVELPPETGALTREEQRELRRERTRELVAEAEAIRERVLAGSAFATIAATRSDDEASRESGGNLPGIVLPGDWPLTVLDAIAELEVGGVTPALEARGGVWLFQARSVDVVPLETVREDLVRELLERGPGAAVLSAFTDRVRGALTWSYPAEEVEVDPRGQLERGRIVVDGEPVPLVEFARWLVRTEGETYAPEFVAREEVRRLAREHEVTVTDAELRERLDRELLWTLEMGFKGKKELWLARLEQNGSSEEAWRRDVGRKLRVQMLVEKLVARDRVVTDDDARSLFLERYGPEGERVDARFVAFRLEIEPQREDETDRAWRSRVRDAAQPLLETFDELRQRYDDGEDFAALARRYSQDAASAANGGRPPGGFDERDYPDDVRRALHALPLGVLSEPQVVGTRVLFFEVTERTKVDFEALREDLLRELRSTPPSPVQVATYLNARTAAVAPRVLPGMWR